MASTQLRRALLSAIVILISLINAEPTPRDLSLSPLSGRDVLRNRQLGLRSPVPESNEPEVIHHQKRADAPDRSLREYCRTPGELFAMKPDDYLRLVYKDFGADIDRLKTAYAIRDPKMAINFPTARSPSEIVYPNQSPSAYYNRVARTMRRAS